MFNEHSFMQSYRKLLHFYCLHSFNYRELCACKGSVEDFVRGAPNSHRYQEFGTDILTFFK